MMAKAMSCEEFVRRAKLIHGDDYDYSCTNYINMTHKVEIRCKVHGIFEQLPQPHLKGQGCPICGREKYKNTMLKRYGVDNPMKNSDIYERARQTCVKNYGFRWAMSNAEIKKKSQDGVFAKYGVRHPLQSSEIYKKMVETIRNLYGVENVMHSAYILAKVRETCLSRYGFEYALSSPVVRAKISETNFERYGGVAPLSSEDVRNKLRETVMARYGVDSVTQLDDVKLKILESKSKNKTFHTSVCEEVLYEMLCDVFGVDDVVRQYYSELYPFACDFYIKSRDMYVELNASWTHGNRWFTGDDDDKCVLSVWSDRNTKYYRNAINVWTDADVKKREMAMQADLNYVVFWDSALRDAELWFASGCPDGHDYLRMYSWIEERDFSDVVSGVCFTGTVSNLSLVAKHYQFDVFYAKEISLWNENPIFRGLTLQMWLYCNRYQYLGKIPNDLSDFEMLRAFTISGVRKGYTVFCSDLESAVLDKYNIQSVYDPCAGWGERMLCCYSKNVDYYGVDVNRKLERGYVRMMQDLQMVGQHIVFDDSSVYVPTVQVNAVITCPPYGNIEIYSEFGAENFSENDFLLWWDKVVKNSMVSNPKYFCFQANCKWKNALRCVVEQNGFTFVEELLPTNVKSSHFTRKSNQNLKVEFESMLVFKF